MPTTTIFLIALAAIFALGFVFFKYFLGNKNPGRNTYILACLRFLTVFILLLLLINPGITQRELETEKPDLFVAVDRSYSIEHIQQGENVLDLAQEITNNDDLNERFAIQVYGFGNELEIQREEQNVFDKPQTNISLSLRDLEKLSRNKKSAIVLITDGNQTVGENYQFYSSGGKTGIYPVIVGDTTAHLDLAISNLNVNKYAFLNNDFPVEILLNFTGNEDVQTRFEIRSGNAVLFSKAVNFSNENASEIINTTLPATRLGASVYEAVIVPLDSEKNIINNSRKFGVEVIDERTSVLLLSSIAHPDLGAIKKSIEQNEQREVSIEYIDNYSSSNIADFQLVVLYQPNNQFNQVFSDINSQRLNYFMITGTQTDWNFVNSVQQDFNRDFTDQSQDVFGIYNRNFSQFQFDDINFERFPPLKDRFGTLNFETDIYSPLLLQRIEGIATEFPLLAIAESNDRKKGVLFGEDLWKWRSQSFVDTGSFESFDNFIGKLVQYLASTQKRDRLTFEAEAVYLENESILITARYFDQNYVFNPGGELEIEIRNMATEEMVRAPMLLSNNRFGFETGTLVPGEYSFSIREVNSGISRTGNFVVLEYNIEQQFSSANLKGMQNLASNNSGQLYFLNTGEELIEELLRDNTYVSVQKSREKIIPLVHWKILLLLLVASLATEWFTRKYFGLI
ncbi:MAG TPA: hypothetical protein VLN46_04380 [Gillisia sp.]|nr:hypothetical protein [Gillisia sp.]